MVKYKERTMTVTKAILMVLHVSNRQERLRIEYNGIRYKFNSEQSIMLNKILDPFDLQKLYYKLKYIVLKENDPMAVKILSFIKEWSK